jgi:hypothetical protein
VDPEELRSCILSSRRMWSYRSVKRGQRCSPALTKTHAASFAAPSDAETSPSSKLRCLFLSCMSHSYTSRVQLTIARVTRARLSQKLAKGPFSLILVLCLRTPQSACNPTPPECCQPPGFPLLLT